MKLNLANPATGCQKMIDLEDDKKLGIFMEKRLAAEVEADALGDEFKGYVLKIMGGQDKQGFPMKQGVLTKDRVRLMLSKGEQCCRGYGMRKGERYRKSVRGCIIGHNISVLHCIIVKKGPEELPGLTDKSIPRRLGPKRASKLRKLFNLTKDGIPRRLGPKRASKLRKLFNLTDKSIPRRLGPKRASKLAASGGQCDSSQILQPLLVRPRHYRPHINNKVNSPNPHSHQILSTDLQDDVRKFVIRREVPSKEEGGKPRDSKAPKIQRLVTPVTLQRKRARMGIKKTRQIKAKVEAAEYAKMLAVRSKEAKEKKMDKIS
eukprot:CAMPEP_0179979350 /NCGR_PEP_ID=MMETSP0983-20121128/41308_1 /TAXON_ID=483367 /ORGANISM="non described non described, Strain CCMP 2436" /LENGTH=318 /DNA_ID=CAMNT_0021897123 /DNA_START=30 /DNA_END=986 /DNA_ORIENTATION=-